jgi:lysophospholipase L1-like esterase
MFRSSKFYAKGLLPLLPLIAVTLMFSQLVGEPNTTDQVASANQTKQHTALFIGDSFTVGIGAPKTTDGFAYRVAKQFHWSLQNYAVGHTGYAKGDKLGDSAVETNCQSDRGCPNYLKQFDQAVKAGVVPEVIVVSGGYNDTASDDLFDSAKQLFAKIHTTFAAATLYVTSPITVAKVSDEFKVRIAMVRVACFQTKTTFLDLGQPLSERRELRNRIHPNLNGYKVLAQTLSALIAANQPQAAGVSRR